MSIYCAKCGHKHDCTACPECHGFGYAQPKGISAMTLKEAARYGWEHASWSLENVLLGVEERHPVDSSTAHAEIAQNAEAAKRLKALNKALDEYSAWPQVIGVRKRAEEIMLEGK